MTLNTCCSKVNPVLGVGVDEALEICTTFVDGNLSTNRTRDGLILHMTMMNSAAPYWTALNGHKFENYSDTNVN
jgi:hypothetical protein